MDGMGSLDPAARSAGPHSGFPTNAARFWYSRDEVIDRMNEIIAAPVTRTIRGLKTEVLLTEEDGMPAACAVNFDQISLGQRDRFGSLLCSLYEGSWPEVRRALLSVTTSNIPAAKSCLRLP
jgi:mRNA-degrading endonuclease toxin of MazEF toxin-antitoxin module